MNWRRHKDIGANSKPYLYGKNEHKPRLIEANGYSTRVSSNFLLLCVGLLPNQDIGCDAGATSASRQRMPNWKVLDLTLILTSRPTFLSVRLEKKSMRIHNGMRPMQKPILLERSTGFRIAAAIGVRQTSEIRDSALDDRRSDR